MTLCLVNQERPRSDGIVPPPSERVQVHASIRAPGIQWDGKVDPALLLDLIDILPHIAQVRIDGYGNVSALYQEGELQTIEVRRTIKIKRHRIVATHG